MNDKEYIFDLVYEFLQMCRVEIFSRFISGKKNKDAHKFIELLLVDTSRCLLGKLSPLHFYPDIRRYIKGNTHTVVFRYIPSCSMLFLALWSVISLTSGV